MFLDRIYTSAPDGRAARPLTADVSGVQREPAWSRDGRLAFAMDSGDGFDIHVAGRGVQRLTSLAGDERRPTWTPDGRIVFAHRPPESTQWDLYVAAPDRSEPERLTDTDDNEMQPSVSPDGRRIAFASDRQNDDGDVDIWVMRLGPHSGGQGVSPADKKDPQKDPPWNPVRVVQARGADGSPSWSPEGDRLAFYAVREGIGSTWVTTVDPMPDADRANAAVPRERPSHPPILVSRHGGSLAWSPDGRMIAIGEIPDPDPIYNGNPHRDRSDPPPVFGLGRAYQLWTVPAPRPVDEGGRIIAPAVSTSAATLTHAFDRVWSTLNTLYYANGNGAAAWDALRAKYRPRAQQARGEDALEDAVDAMVTEQPLIKPAIVSSRAIVVSGHPLASEAGRLALERGGNVVDAAIAVSFALGVVEPEASGIGGDGQAVLHLTGMAEPTVVEYKDQTPMRATLDNPKIFRNGRLVGDGAAAANIPGVVAGLGYLYKRYGSGRVTWASLIEPAIKYADEGFILDDALPSSIAEGRQYLKKYSEAERIYLPGGRLPKPGDRFVNKEYAETLRVIAREGADEFYRGTLARRIAADLEANGGIMTYRGSRPVPRNRAQAGHGSVSRSCALHGRAARRLRCVAARGAADPGPLRRETGRYACNGSGLLAPHDRVLEDQGADAAHRRPGALARGL